MESMYDHVCYVLPPDCPGVLWATSNQMVHPNFGHRVRYYDQRSLKDFKRHLVHKEPSLLGYDHNDRVKYTITGNMYTSYDKADWHRYIPAEYRKRDWSHVTFNGKPI